MARAILTQRPNNKGVTIVELLVVACVFLLMAGALAPFVSMARERSQRFYCADNLRKISLGLHAYAADNNESFPASLEQLYPKYVDSRKILDCPAVGTRAGKDKTGYRYILGLTEAAPPKEIIVEDLNGNHKADSGNILRVDGSIEWAKARH